MLSVLLVVVFLLTGFGNVAVAEEKNQVVITGREKGASTSPSSVSDDVVAFFKRLGRPQRSGTAVSLASSYDPNFNNSLMLAAVSAIYDHGLLWDNIRSGTKFFKLEGSAGVLLRPELRTVTSMNMLAMYYPAVLQNSIFRLYLEAGIGAIYTDYRVHDQAYRHNFNPQLGIGTEVRQLDGTTLFVAMRLHHVSNGGINHDNQGVNSLLFQIGKYY
jgi:lipid A 3-O-deacylase